MNQLSLHKSSPRLMSIREMYDITHKGANKLFLESYTIPKHYVNTSKIQHYEASDRRGSEQALDDIGMTSKKKKRKNSGYRRDFVDDLIRQKKKIPAVGTYMPTKSWAEEVREEEKSTHLSTQQAQELNKSRLSSKPCRNTVFEELLIKNNKDKYPGPAHYKADALILSPSPKGYIISSATANRSLLNDSSQGKSSHKYLARNSAADHNDSSTLYTSRPTYLDDCSFAGTEVPGVGAYSPRKQWEIEPQYKVLNISKNTFNTARSFSPQNRAKKSNSIGYKYLKNRKKEKRDIVPPVGSYNPLPVIFDTFDKIKSVPVAKERHPQNQIFRQQQEGKIQQSIPLFDRLPHLGFGIAPRSASPSPTRQVQPGFVHMAMKWAGKKDKAGAVTNILDRITKGVNKSIYYE